MIAIEQKRNYLVYYARNREDLLLQALFDKSFKGSYLEVGPSHPIHHSATKLLYKSGWRGAHCSPDNQLIEMMAYDRKFDVTKRIKSSELGGLIDVVTKENDIKAVDVLIITDSDFTLPLLKGHDWKRLRPRVICFPSDPKNEARNYLQTHGYELTLADGASDYCVDTTSGRGTVQIEFPKKLLNGAHVVDNDVAGNVAIQNLRAETTEIINHGLRVPARQPSVRLLKETIHLTLRELKHLVKENTKPRRVALTPEHVAQAPESTDSLPAYLKQVNALYKEEFADIQAHERSLIPKSKSAAMIKRAKLMGYDTPRLVLGETGRVLRRRMK